MKNKSRSNNKNKKPWPTDAAMKQVYEKQLWGTNGTLYYSGQGSHDPYIVAPYIKAIRAFLDTFKNKMRICDLGCGDHNIGSYLTMYASSYTGVDIVPDLILHNNLKYGGDLVNFVHLDIAQDDLPQADIVILRQVLQHLSNSEILQIISKLYQYKYLVLTEHLPNGDFIPNLDIISGQGIRLKKNSGVVLTTTPFNLTYKKATELISTVLPTNKGKIKTTCYEF